jgi:integrase
LAESRPDVVRALIAKRLTPLEVWAAFRVGNLTSLPLAPEAMLLLAPAFERWAEALRNAEGVPASESHKKSLLLSLGHLAPHARTVSDLPKALVAARAELLPRRKRTYQLVKAAAQGFLRDLVGKHHLLYLSVADVPGVRVTPERRGGIPIEAFRDAISELAGEHVAQAWAMAGTGMGPDEYFRRKWEIRSGDQVAIRGTKREARRRVVPLVVPVRGPFTRYAAFRLALATVGLQPYDLRRCFAHWCEQAGIQRTRIKLYLGHSTAAEDITGGYLHHDVAPYLKADAKLLAAYIGPVHAGLKLEQQA